MMMDGRSLWGQCFSFQWIILDYSFKEEKEFTLWVLMVNGLWLNSTCHLLTNKQLFIIGIDIHCSIIYSDIDYFLLYAHPGTSTTDYRFSYRSVLPC